MKKVVFALIAVVCFASCSKKYNYECQTETFGQSSGVKNIVQKHCTQNAIERYIKKNSAGNNDGVLRQGEQITICVKK